MVVELQHNTFKNLKVFITGTSSGIGHAVSKAYLERGSIVYGIDNKNNKSLNLQFKVLNALTAPKENPIVEFRIKT